MTHDRGGMGVSFQFHHHLSRGGGTAVRQAHDPDIILVYIPQYLIVTLTGMLSLGLNDTLPEGGIIPA